MLLFCGARFTARASDRVARQRSGTTRFHTKITHLGYTRIYYTYYNTVTGPGLPLFPPPRNGGPAFFFALFTRLPRREILRSSHGPGSTPSSLLMYRRGTLGKVLHKNQIIPLGRITRLRRGRPRGLVPIETSTSLTRTPPRNYYGYRRRRLPGGLAPKVPLEPKAQLLNQKSPKEKAGAL